MAFPATVARHWFLFKEASMVRLGKPTKELIDKHVRLDLYYLMWLETDAQATAGVWYHLVVAIQKRIAERIVRQMEAL